MAKQKRGPAARNAIAFLGLGEKSKAREVFCPHGRGRVCANPSAAAKRLRSIIANAKRIGNNVIVKDAELALEALGY